MSKESGLGWLAQLQKVRGVVENMEKQRAEDQRLKLERSREALKERLKHDTPSSLSQEFQDLRKDCDRAARRFYPPDDLQQALNRIADFRKRLEFYKGCYKDFSDLFTPQLTQVIDRSFEDLKAVTSGIERQLSQWTEVQALLQDITFRPKQDADNRPLTQAAKAFSERAHGMGLSMPADFFAGEKEGFFVVAIKDALIGYIKYWEDRQVITFALDPPPKTNFPKFVRGVLHKAYTGPLAEKKQDSVRVRLSMSREVKFFTDLGFSRKETISVSEWIFERPLT